jgi:hypothetical protein
MLQFRRILTPFMALAALLGATAPAVASSEGEKAPAYPESEVLAAFRAACTEFGDFDKAHSQAMAQGWSDIAVDETTPGGRIVLFGEGMVKNNPDITVIKGPLLRRDVMGRDLFLAISGAQVDGDISKGCRLYDFAAPAPLAPKVLVAFMGRHAETDRAPFPGFTIASWTPGMAKGHIEFEVAHVAQGTTLPANMPISGIMLKAQIVEIDKR